MKLSISQQDFADFLGISRSQLSMYELHERSLPFAAMQKLSQMELMQYNMQQGKLISPLSKTQEASLKKLHDRIKKEMLAQVETSKYKKLLAGRQLDNMIAEHAKAKVWSELIGHMIAATQQNKENKIDLLWLEIQQRKTLKKMIRHGTASQEKIKAKQLVLENEMDVCKEMLDKINWVEFFGADFPYSVQDLIKFGDNKYDTYVADGQTLFSGDDNYQV